MKAIIVCTPIRLYSRKPQHLLTCNLVYFPIRATRRDTLLYYGQKVREPGKSGSRHTIDSVDFKG